MDENLDCILLHGWGVSNGVWQDFSDQLKGFNKVSTPSLYEIASNTEDNKLESIAAALSEKINADSIVVAWSIGGLIATHMAKLTNKIKAVIFIASTPCFINKKNWPNVIDRNNICNLQKKLLKNTENTLEYFAGLIAHGDIPIKNTNKFLRGNLANEKYKIMLSDWLTQMQETDQRKEFAELNIPALLILGENDSLINSKMESQIKQLNFNIEHKAVKDCGHAPFISKREETIKIINDFINAKFN
jgi:pimeloyl-[acyl-carrier protein] methyl ester esterase